MQRHRHTAALRDWAWKAQLGKVKIAPVARYTHWAADPDFAGSRSKRNQVELLMGVSF